MFNRVSINRFGLTEFLEQPPGCRSTRNRRPRRRLGVELLEARAVLSITVNTLLDEADGSLVDGDVSLRDAVTLAASGETIEFDSGLTSGGLATITLSLGEIPIIKDLVLSGPGANLLAVDASGNDPTPAINDGKGSRVFNIDDGLATDIRVSIESLRLSGGDVATNGGAIFNAERLTMNASIVSGNSALSNGGGIYDRTSLQMNAMIFSENSARGVASITSASLTMLNSTLSSNTSYYSLELGAGARNGEVSLIQHTTITGNNSVFLYSASGGSIEVRDSAMDGPISANNYGSATIANTTISGGGGGILVSTFPGATTIIANSVIAGHLGNGIYARTDAGGLFTITGSTISGNRGGRRGGGIYSTGQGQTTIRDCTISGNTALEGGGIASVSGGRLLVQNSTITGNIATGLGSAYPNGGGGILASGELTLLNATISGNSARKGGGINIANVHIGDFENTVIAGNTASEVAPDVWGTLDIPSRRITFSLVGDNTGSQLAEAQTPDANGNLVGNPAGAGVIDPLLGLLADNGGPTQTMALLPGSRAIDAGDPSAVAGAGGVPMYDQRGTKFGRVHDGDNDQTSRIDMGALEVQTPTGPACDFDDDGHCDIVDLDALVMHIVSGSHTPSFDLTNDGLVDLDDRNLWLIDAGALNLMSGRPYLLGDANLDGVVDGSDFNIWNSHKFTSVSAWSAGDFNTDGAVDGSDFGIWNSNKFTSSDRGSKGQVAAAGISASDIFRPSGHVRMRKQIARRIVTAHAPS